MVGLQEVCCKCVVYVLHTNKRSSVGRLVDMMLFLEHVSQTAEAGMNRNVERRQGELTSVPSVI